MRKSFLKKGKIFIMSFCAILLMSTICYAEDNMDQEGISNAEFGEMYSNEFFEVADYYEDEDGVLVFQRVQENDDSGLMRTNANEKAYVSDVVCVFDMTEDEKEELLRYVENVKMEQTSGVATYGSRYDYEWDSSGGCKAYSTVYFTRTTSNGSNFIEVTKVTGGFVGGSGTTGSVVGSGVVVVAQDVTIGQTGKPEGKALRTQQVNYTIANSTRSWTKYPGDWYPVQEGVVGTHVGATYYIELRRGTSTSTWSIELVNHVIDNGMSFM